MTQNLQKNKTCPAKLQRSRGFVILFAITLSAILLSIALGAANIALREIKFGTSAKDTNDAFFAADTGAEQVLFNDKDPNSYLAPTSGSTQSWGPIIVSSLGSTGASCARITIKKDYTGSELKTTVVSKGYNIGSSACNSTSLNLVEREMDWNY